MNDNAAVLLDPERPIAVFDDFRSQLAKFKKINENTVFDYEDPKGNKEARSHIYQLRRSKAAVEKKRKEEKAIALEYGRKVDAEAKEIIGEFEGMIEVHQAPINEIEEREEERKRSIQAEIDDIKAMGAGLHQYQAEQGSLDAIDETLEILDQINPEEGFDEFADNARQARHDAIERLRARYHELQVQIEKDAELERLRKEQAERDAKEAAERAEREAAEAAERKKREEEEAKLRAELEEMRKEKAERDAAEARAKQEAEQKAQAEKEAAEAAEREKREAEQRKAQEREAAARRELEADAQAEREQAERKEREQAKRELADRIIYDLNAGGLKLDQAERAAHLILAGRVRDCRINS